MSSEFQIDWGEIENLLGLARFGLTEMVSPAKTPPAQASTSFGNDEAGILRPFPVASSKSSNIT